MPGPEARAAAPVRMRPMAAPQPIGAPGPYVQRPESGFRDTRLSPSAPQSERTAPQWALDAVNSLQKLGINLHAFPLAEIPLGTRVEVKDMRKLRTARHELSHAKAIEGQGGTVLHVSVQADSTSWGRTLGAGMTKEQFQVAAMASVVDGHDGTSMDKFQTELIAHHGGMSVESAASTARGILSKSNPDIDERVAQMIAHYENVDGKLYSQIYLRASYDALIDGAIGLEVFRTVIQKLEEHDKRYDAHVTLAPQDRVEITDRLDGKTSYVRVEKGVRVQEITRCSSCGKASGHTPECKAVQQSDTRTEKLQPTGGKEPSRRGPRTQRLHQPANPLPLAA